MVSLPEVLQLPDERRFTSRLHHPGVAARLGAALGVTFTICLVTGVVSHYMQEPPGWLLWPSRPVNLYRVNQGVHVLSGIASVPLLLAKLWTVYPKLFQRPILGSFSHAVERAFVILLVGGATFQLATGLLNVTAIYPWSFSFRRVHFAMAFVLYGALLIHIGHKFAIARRELRTPLADDPADEAASGLTDARPTDSASAAAGTTPVDVAEAPRDGLSRRGFLWSVGAATGVLVVGTAGQTLPLPEGAARWLSPFATHLPHVGPQGLPVRTSAAGAGVEAAASDPAYRLTITGAVPAETALTLDDLRAMPLTTVTLPITCVEGWSASGIWRGVAVRDLVAAVGGAKGSAVRVMSLQESGSYTESMVDPPHADDPLTLLALELNGEPLHLDHGYPCRLVAPNRPGVLQTKWLTGVEVIA